MTCCNEAGCRRGKPILVRQGGLSRRWFIITDYKVSGDRGEFIESKTKHDITDELTAALVEAGWAPPPSSTNSHDRGLNERDDA